MRVPFADDRGCLPFSTAASQQVAQTEVMGESSDNSREAGGEDRRKQVLQCAVTSEACCTCNVFPSVYRGAHAGALPCLALFPLHF